MSDHGASHYVKSSLAVTSVAAGIMVATLSGGLAVLAVCRWWGVAEPVAHIAEGAASMVSLGLAVAVVFLLRHDRGTTLDRAAARAGAEVAADQARQGVLDSETEQVLLELEVVASAPSARRDWPGLSEAVSAGLRARSGSDFTPLHRQAIEDWRSQVAHSGGWGRHAYWRDAVDALVAVVDARTCRGSAAEEAGAPSPPGRSEAPRRPAPALSDYDRLRQLVFAWREARCVSEPACGTSDGPAHLPTCPVEVTENALVDEVDSWRRAEAARVAEERAGEGACVERGETRFRVTVRGGRGSME